MRHILAAIAAAVTLIACGGGDSTDTALITATTTATTLAATEDAPTPAAIVPQLAADAPWSNLDLATNASYATTTSSTQCGYAVPSKSITGTVTSVHDGDTIKIGSTSIRLDSIDAPELAQTYGTQSRDNLSALVLNKSVTVYYSKIDKYGRTVGSVFTSDCTYANLQQVRSGSAWHYKQYQCEQAASVRDVFTAAQTAAEAADLGLWAFVATPPWVYRNGTDPAAPTCKSDNPSWYVAPTTVSNPVTAPTVTTPAPTASTFVPFVSPVTPIAVVTPPTPPTTTGSSSGSGASTYTPTNSCYKVWVNGYYRKNGTYVKGYYRNSPGCA